MNESLNMEGMWVMLKSIFLACLLLAVVFFLCACQRLPNDPQQAPVNSPVHTQPEKTACDVISFSFSERRTYNKRVQGYEFRTDDGRHTVCFWLANEEEPYAIEADQAWVDALKEIISKHNMLTWDGFRGTNDLLMDGKSFSMDMTLSDGRAVHAGGYGTFPPGYGEASSAIDKHFLKLLPEELQDW